MRRIQKLLLITALSVFAGTGYSIFLLEQLNAQEQDVEVRDSEAGEDFAGGGCNCGGGSGSCGGGQVCADTCHSQTRGTCRALRP